MVDYTRLNVAQTHGDKIATDEIAGVKYQRVKLTQGADGVNDGDVSASNPMPATIYGINAAGNTVSMPVTSEGHLEVAIHAPRLPFGSIHAERLSPVFQVDGVYGVNPYLVNTTTGLAVGIGTGTGSVTASGNKIVASTGTTSLSFATFQSRRRLRYRPGQGVVGRFTAHFSQGVADSILVAGFGTAESGVYFGFNGTSYGILYSTGGVREIHTMTITRESTATNSYVVTLPNGDTATVAATNNSSIPRTAWEIAQGTFPGWDATAQGSTVVFVAASAGPKTGTFTLAQTGAGTPALGSDAETLAGVASTDTWIPKEEWNGDVLDGSGSASNPSGVLLDPTKGNVYQIGIQYLGFGALSFEIECALPNRNNPEFVVVHTIKYPNTSTSVSLTQPAFPFTAAAYSAGSTDNVSVSIGSFAGFIEGEIVKGGPRSSYFNNTGISTSTSAYAPIFSITNSLTYAGRPNQSVCYLLDVSCAARSVNGLTTFYVVRNPILTGPTNFQKFSTQSSTYWDTASTGVSFASNSDVIWSGMVSEAGNLSRPFGDTEITLQPGDVVALIARSVTATATCVGSLNIREDQ